MNMPTAHYADLWVTTWMCKALDHKLVNECYQCKYYLRWFTVQRNLKCPEILLLIYERNFVDTFPNLITMLKISCGITNTEL